jgi:hypothetical protein
MSCHRSSQNLSGDNHINGPAFSPLLVGASSDRDRPVFRKAGLCRSGINARYRQLREQAALIITGNYAKKQ